MIVESKLFGLIGYPLTHSFSKRYFTEKFAKENIVSCSYELFPLSSIEALPELLNLYPQLRGLNVTIPYKEVIFPYLRHTHPSVMEIGACNCIDIRNGELTGYNTDIIGFERMVLPYLKSHHTNALLLGTGGAAKAVAWVLRRNYISFTYVSRIKGAQCITYADIDKDLMQQNTLIINTTPLGMSPDLETFPQIPYEYINDRHLCVDLIYNPAKTRFLELSEKKGAAILNGLEMLVIQAEESWNIWQKGA